MNNCWNIYNPAFHLIILLPLTGCIEQYYPDEDELKTGTMAVVASLTNKPGLQSINISRSSTIIYPEYDPVSGCLVKIESVNGTERVLKEASPGFYRGNLDEDFMLTGEEYRLCFITAGGERYESDYEKIYQAPEIDTVYFVREDQNTRDPEVILEGVQFYVDFEIGKDSGRYLRWKLTETYEINNPDNVAYVYDVDRSLKQVPDTSNWLRCWITREVPEIYTMDFGNVDGEIYRGMALSFVSSETRRLHFRYSLLVEQLALSQASFHYWDELGKNLQSQGNLFDTQPALTPGNICNSENSDEVVVGYFSISGVNDRRIIVGQIPGLNIVKDPYYCAPGSPPAFLFYMHDRYLPVYMAGGWYIGDWWFGEVKKYCVDCRDYKGSSHIKPDFW